MRTVCGVLSLIWKFYIAIVFTTTAVIYYPIIFPFLLNEKSKKTAFYFFVAWSWTVRILCFYYVVKKLNSPLPKEPYIVVSNHSSYLDIFLMYSIMSQQPFIFLGKSEILRYPLIKTYFKRFNIPVFRGNGIKAGRAFVAAAKKMKMGWSLVIFPEGGIPDNENPKMIQFKDGAFQLAKSLNVAIVPMTFTNNHILFSDPTNILGPARPGISHAYIHPFISKEEVERMSSVELKEKCFEIINAPILEMYPRFR